MAAPSRKLPGALALVIALAAPRAAAADPEADAVAKADALFAEGVKLRDSNLELACAKFGQSLQLNPQAIGAVLNVAMCEEKLGRITSAVRRYRETRERAIEQNFPEYRKAAEAELQVLEPEIPHLAIRFEKPPLPGTKVVVDDEVVPESELGRLAVDPGVRVIVVSAPGRIAFQRTIEIARHEDREVKVPPLERPSSRRKIGKVTLGAGAAAIAGGVVLGLIARDRYNSYSHMTVTENGVQVPLCTASGDRLICDARAYSSMKTALLLGDIGTVVGGVGVAAAIAGGYLWLFAPEPHEHRRVSVVPHAAPGAAGLTVLGRF